MLERKEAGRPNRVFIHGLESSAQGRKGVFFKTRYPGMIVQDYVGSFSRRMKKLKADLEDKDNLIIVGSSYGGLMATVFAGKWQEKVKKLILLAPALNLLPEEELFTMQINVPTFVYHGKHDEVVPEYIVRRRAEKLFTNLKYHLLDDDHTLNATFTTLNWDSLLSLEIPQ